MKITAVDREHTKSEKSIAFRTDVPPTDELIGRAKFRKVQISLADGLLIISPRDEDVDTAFIRDINALFAKTEAAIQREKEAAADAHRQLLDRIGTATGLPVK